MHRSITLLAAGAVLASTLAGAPSTARAEPDPDHVGSFSFTNDEYIDLCGVNVHLVEDVVWNYRNAKIHGPGEGVWDSIVHLEVAATFTNEANGRYITEKLREIWDRVLTAPIVYDNVHHITALGVRNDKAWDMDGNLIYHEAGSHQTEFLFDDGGDGAPGGGSFVTEPTTIRLSGMHPSEDEACAAIVAALEG